VQEQKTHSQVNMIHSNFARQNQPLKSPLSWMALNWVDLSWHSCNLP